MAATPPAEPAPPAPSAPQPPNPALPDQPTLSTSDDGTSKRPRDVRLLHLVLSSLGVHSYQERVPLQLLDFAYRYTSGILSDSLRLAGEGYVSSTGPASKRGATAAADPGDGSNITVSALRQAIASRMDGQFTAALPKEWLLEHAEGRNRVALPRIERGFGVQLPPERYVLTGQSWGLLEEWNSDGEEGERVNGSQGGADERMGGMDGEEGEEQGEGFEDVFGEEEMKDA